MNRRPLLILAALTLSTTATLTSGGGQAAQAAGTGCIVTNPAATYANDTPPPLAVQDQERAASDLLQGIVAGHDDEYAGAQVDWTTPAIDVWVLPTATQLSSQLLSSSSWFRVHPAVRSLQDMRSFDDGIVPSDLAFATAGTTLTQTYEDFTSGCVGIGISPYTTVAADALRAHYGADRVDVYEAASATAGTSRLADSAPWNGGDYTDSTNGNCTSGLPMKDATYYYLLEAAHCYPLNQSVYNGSTYSSGTLSNKMGTVVRRDAYYTKTTDTELVKVGSSSALVWSSQTSRRTVKSVHYPNAGEYVCVSGAYELEVCSAKVLGVYKVTYTDNVSGQPAVSYQITAKRSGVALAGQGDSGGPMYQVNSAGGAVANGMFSTFTANIACRSGSYGAAVRKCGDNANFMDVTTILGYYGTVSFRTG